MQQTKPVVRAARPEDRDDLGFTPNGRMTEWFSPTTLLDMAFRTMWTTLVERYADRRETMKLRIDGRRPAGPPRDRVDGDGDGDGAAQPEGIYELVDDQEEVPGSANDFVLDYVADLGDGFHPTFTVAQLIASDSISPIDRATTGGLGTTAGAAAEPGHAMAEATTLRRADVVIMGGDEVYPRATKQNYWNRTIGPYRWASETSETTMNANADLYALPGNHDWYDGLGEFMKWFCTGDVMGTRGSWNTPQRASYFALQLPNRWWLLAVDTQLEGELDYFQREYFKTQRFEPGDQVIVCWSTPVWAKEHHKPGSINPLMTFLNEVIPVDVIVPLVLTGDEHYYARYLQHPPPDPAWPDRDPRLWITAGGGGAFLHPTHTLQDVLTLEPGSPREKWRAIELQLVEPSCFPTKQESQRLAWTVAAFPVLNPRFLYITAGLSVALAAAVPYPVVYLALGGAITAALMGFARIGYENKLIGNVAGALHGVAQVGGAWLVMRAVRGRLEDHGGFVGFAAGAALWTLAADVIMAAYLLVSIQAKQHPNEAFSALRSARYKSFVRLRFTAEGSVAIHPIGIRETGRWRFVRTKAKARGTRGFDIEVTRRASREERIEGPVVLRATPAAVRERLREARLKREANHDEHHAPPPTAH
jgi:hypothetical protein